jgi:hypothetical protein
MTQPTIATTHTTQSQAGGVFYFLFLALLSSFSSVSWRLLIINENIRNYDKHGFWDLCLIFDIKYDKTKISIFTNIKDLICQCFVENFFYNRNK